MIRLAIVGGGPGGLMAAYHVRKKIGDLAKVTIFEASDRLGGKIMTRKFETVPALYEAGVAEIYGYSNLGPDPLRELIEEFGFQTVPMTSDEVVLDRRLLNGLDDIDKVYGRKTGDQIRRFRRLCTRQLSPAAYYEGVGKQDNDHEWAWKTAEEILNAEISDKTARKFIRVMARSDIASETHLTNGLNALKNYLMDVDGYIDVYSICNGNESLVDGLVKSTDAEILLNQRVLKIGKVDGESYRLSILNGHAIEQREFDVVLVCLPHNWLGTIEWDDEVLREAMSKHIAHFDRPAHYLRIAALFEKGFLDGKVQGSWFMSEAFGGCCVYVEGARHDVAGHGVLNWLIAGADVLAYSNLSDAELIDVALKTLPADFGDARQHLREFRTHRWLASVNAIPGGTPVRDAITNHVPEPKEHSGIIVVGDYLFDSTLNGLLDSADIATDLILTQIMRRRYDTGIAKAIAATEPNPVIVPDPSPRIDRTYFDCYRGIGPYAEVWRRFSDPDYIIAMIRTAWRAGPKFKLLVTGSASGELVGALRERGIDAWGIENNRYIHSKTPKELRRYNLFGDAADMPFKDGSFDFVYETSLAYGSKAKARRVIAELHRVTRKGVYFATVTSDLTSDVLDMYDLIRGVKMLATWWEWTELFFERDFELSIEGNALLGRLWKRTVDAGKGPGQWYEDSESLRYCFYTRLEPEEEE